MEVKTSDHKQQNATGDKKQVEEESASTSTQVLPCMDRLREELSCAVRTFLIIVNLLSY